MFRKYKFWVYWAFQGHFGPENGSKTILGIKHAIKTIKIGMNQGWDPWSLELLWLGLLISIRTLEGLDFFHCTSNALVKDNNKKKKG